MKKQHPHEHLKTRELTILELRASFFPWLWHKQNTPSKKHEDCEKKEENPYFLGGGPKNESSNRKFTCPSRISSTTTTTLPVEEGTTPRAIPQQYNCTFN
jgi:hypothetical protein